MKVKFFGKKFLENSGLGVLAFKRVKFLAHKISFNTQKMRVVFRPHALQQLKHNSIWLQMVSLNTNVFQLFPI